MGADHATIATRGVCIGSVLSASQGRVTRPREGGLDNSLDEAHAHLRDSGMAPAGPGDLQTLPRRRRVPSANDLL